MRQASIPCTLSENMCTTLIGVDLPGKIVRVECEEYDFTIPDTGEIITLSHRWEVLHEGEAAESTVDEVVIGDKEPEENVIQ